MRGGSDSGELGAGVFRGAEACLVCSEGTRVAQEACWWPWFGAGGSGLLGRRATVALGGGAHRGDFFAASSGMVSLWGSAAAYIGAEEEVSD